jgi:DNA-directed RNA polymerase beta subunit
MDVPRHILKLLFTDSTFPLIQHHLDSFNDFLDVGIPEFLRALNADRPFELELRDGRFIRVFVGGKESKNIRYTSPVEELGAAIIVPHACRLDNRTYAMSVRADIDIEYTFPDKTVQVRSFKDILIGQIPLMLRSRLCYLSGIDGYTIGECKFELGGYFIIDGAEKVLLTQELLGNNLFYAGTRKRQKPKGSMKTLMEKEDPVDTSLDKKTSYEEATEVYSAIRTISEDGSRGPYSHFLVLPAETIGSTKEGAYTADDLNESPDPNLGRDNRLVIIQLPGYQQPVPFFSVFRALGVTSDRDVYDLVLAGVPDKDRVVYDEILYQLLLSHDKFIEKARTTDLELLSIYTRSKSRFEVVTNLHETLFSFVDFKTEDAGALFRHKAYLLAHMLKLAIDVDLGRREPSDRDNMQFKRMKTSGVLMFEEFRRIFREIGQSMLLDMDKRVQYEASNFRDKNLVNLIEPENIGRYWRGYRMLNEYVSSFKGSWGGRVGIAQELARPSYLAVIHQLRKTDLQIDKSTSTAPPRRLYASQYGIMCPVDSPDGSDIGYKKAFSILARVSTAFPESVVISTLMATGMIRRLEDIHPATWVPSWTRVYINSNLIGVCFGNMETVHKTMIKARRSGVLRYDVSLAWARVANEYRIFCDAGRPARPVYRPGVTEDAVRATRSWADVLSLVDYIDASETDSLKLSFTPYDPDLPSEIHTSFTLSAAANLVPYADHNPGPRNAFSIAQQKQAASIYHTNYNKRFDTISMMAANPQRPLSQTWLYSEMMGAGGCLGYGENALVAVTMYGGHNQEDSVIMNGSALRRGMYQTMYYHSYSVEEEALEMGSKYNAEDKTVTREVTLSTKIANPLKNESVRRQEGMDYSMLDPDGVIRVNTLITENTVLVGILSPIVTATGGVTGYRDISMTPKKGQHGRVDAVYRFHTSDGLLGIKIRIVENRFPVIGDKMASRHSQKGTVGMIYDESEMPFTSKGVRPDIIFNPHGIPTRMTVGQFLESASNKLGVDIGALVDATPFTVSNRIGELRVALMNRGFHPYGHEVLYNGMTGEMMDADIFMGPIYYQRLKHMVEDKINYRDTGPKKLLTHQPTQGRGDGGGLRIGEMERDALVSHGMSKFLTESMMERSDKTTVQFDREAGRIDTSRDLLSLPYSMALFSQELESMHITARVETE